MPDQDNPGHAAVSTIASAISPVTTPITISSVSAEDYADCIAMCNRFLGEGEAHIECIKGCREIESKVASGVGAVIQKSLSPFISL